MGNTVFDSMYDHATSLPSTIAELATDSVKSIYGTEPEVELELEDIPSVEEVEVVEATPYIPSPVDDIMTFDAPLDDLFAEYLAREAAEAAGESVSSNDEVEVEEFTRMESVANSITGLGNQAANAVSRVHEHLPDITQANNQATAIGSTVANVGSTAATAVRTVAPYVSAALPYAKTAYETGKAAAEIGAGFAIGGPAGAAMAGARVLASSMSSIFSSDSGASSKPSNPMAAAVKAPQNNPAPDSSIKLKCD